MTFFYNSFESWPQTFSFKLFAIDCVELFEHLPSTQNWVSFRNDRFPTKMAAIISILLQFVISPPFSTYYSLDFSSDCLLSLSHWHSTNPIIVVVIISSRQFWHICTFHKETHTYLEVQFITVTEIYYIITSSLVPERRRRRVNEVSLNYMMKQYLRRCVCMWEREKEFHNRNSIEMVSNESLCKLCSKNSVK